ncbi:hypothetical protein J6590_100616, partial [Homalodisca vitripennis]
QEAGITKGRKLLRVRPANPTCRGRGLPVDGTMPKTYNSRELRTATEIYFNLKSAG